MKNCCILHGHVFVMQDVAVHRKVISVFLKIVDRAYINLGCLAVWFVSSHMNVKARFNRSSLM